MSRRKRQRREVQLLGSDTTGKIYNSITELWREELCVLPSSEINPTDATEVDASKRRDWYAKGLTYWQNVDATLSGVLGGFAHVSPLDLQTSRQFLKSLPNLRFGDAVDCGAGIGRVARGLLCPLFEKVDLVEPCEAYVLKAKETIESAKLRNFIIKGLQDFEPQEKYDVIWIQWCIGHLTDDDLVEFLERCKNGLNENGYVCLKENTCKDALFVMDRDDTSVTRSDELFRNLFKNAGYKIAQTQLQTQWPPKLFPVRMYALKPV